MRITQRIGLVVFLSIEAFLYWDMMTLDLLQPGSLFQYLSIILCLVFLFIFPHKTKGWVTIVSALVCACVADFFLVIRQDHYLLATVFFTMTQIAFAIRLYWENWERHRFIGTVRVFLFIALEIIGMVVVGAGFDGLLFVTLFYFSTLLVNILHAGLLWHRFPLYFFGLILFVLCDIAVGLAACGPYLTIPAGSFLDTILHWDINLAWLFYLPAQVLITLSVYKEGGLKTPPAVA